MFKIKNKKVAYYLLGIILIFVILSIPFKDGGSTYSFSELLRDLGVLKQIAVGHLPQLGPISSLEGYHFGPLYYYLLFPIAAILNYQLYSLAIISSLFILMSVLGVFALTRDWFKNEWLALFSAGIMALSNLTFQLGKYGSNPNFVPFFTIVFFYSLKRLIDNPRSTKDTLIVAVSAAILTQLHAVPLVVVPLILITALIWTGLKKIPLLNIGLFILTVIVFYYPYLRYEFGHNFSNFQSLLTLPNAAINWVIYPTHILQFYGFFLSPIISLSNFFNTLYIGGLSYFALITVFMALIPIFYHYNSERRRKILETKTQADQTAKDLILLWLAVPALIFVLPLPGMEYFRYYYFLILYPFVCIALAYGLLWLFKKGLHILAIYLIVAFILMQAAQIVLYLNFVR